MGCYERLESRGWETARKENRGEDIMRHKGTEVGIPRDIREQRWGYHET